MAKTTLTFTPSEELVLEVLQARIRLGENIWTFDSRLKPQLEKLSAKGLVNFKNGIIQGTLLAWPTDAGKILLFCDEFTPRIAGKKFAKHQKKLRAEAKTLKRKEKRKGDG